MQSEIYSVHEDFMHEVFNEKIKNGVGEFFLVIKEKSNGDCFRFYSEKYLQVQHHLIGLPKEKKYISCKIWRVLYDYNRIVSMDLIGSKFNFNNVTQVAEDLPF